MDKRSTAMKTKSNRLLKQIFFTLSTIYITAPAFGTADTKHVDKCPTESSNVLNSIKMITSIFSKNKNLQCADAQKNFLRYTREDGEYFSNITNDKIFRQGILSTATIEKAERMDEPASIISKKFLNTVGRDIGSKTEETLPTASGFKTIPAK